MTANQSCAVQLPLHKVGNSIGRSCTQVALWGDLRVRETLMLPPRQRYMPFNFKGSRAGFPGVIPACDFKSACFAFPAASPMLLALFESIHVQVQTGGVSWSGPGSEQR